MHSCVRGALLKGSGTPAFVCVCLCEGWKECRLFNRLSAVLESFMPVERCASSLSLSKAEKAQRR